MYSNNVIHLDEKWFWHWPVRMVNQFGAVIWAEIDRGFRSHSKDNLNQQFFLLFLSQNAFLFVKL